MLSMASVDRELMISSSTGSRSLPFCRRIAVGSYLGHGRKRDWYLYGAKRETRREWNVSFHFSVSLGVKLMDSTMIRASTAPGSMTPDSARKLPLPQSTFPTSQVQTPNPGLKTSPPEISPSWGAHVRYRTASSNSSFGPITSPRLDHGGLGYRHLDPSGPLPRNLYIMGLPLDLTQYGAFGEVS